jgi:hypothetical protein
VHFSTPDGSTDAPRNALTSHGWEIVDHALPFGSIPEKSTVIVVDETISPVLTDLSDEQFAALRDLIERECRLLWVTAG